MLLTKLQALFKYHCPPPPVMTFLLLFQESGYFFDIASLGHGKAGTYNKKYIQH